MIEYRAEQAVTIPAGRLRLTPAQALARAHLVREVARGMYELDGPVQFKAGEVFGFEGELPKAMAAAVEPAKAKRASRSEESKASAEPEG